MVCPCMVGHHVWSHKLLVSYLVTSLVVSYCMFYLIVRYLCFSVSYIVLFFLAVVLPS